jgi:hypothetical protein
MQSFLSGGMPTTVLAVHVAQLVPLSLSTAILSETYRISSELRSQATAGPVSTTVGDHVGIRGAVGSSFFSFVYALALFFGFSFA